MLVVQGSVTAAVTPINLDDVDSVLSAPGDLTVVDEEGESEPLTTFGNTHQYIINKRFTLKYILYVYICMYVSLLFVFVY